MKLFALAACFAIGLSILAIGRSAWAVPTTMPSNAAANAPTTAPTISNKVCPVTKEAVDPKIETVQYKGLTIGFCCEDCVKEFKANPEKYAANLK